MFAELVGVRCQVSGVRQGTRSVLPASRRGINLTEVLIAMGILTLGLLGVAAIFPVGSHYMKQAEIGDRGSAIAQSVMSDIVARGILNPRTWRVRFPPAGSDVSSASFSADARYVPPPVNRYRGTFIRPFGAALGEAIVQPAALVDRTTIVKQFGSAFIIDPAGVAAMAFPGFSQPNWNSVASAFPATAHDLLIGPLSYSTDWKLWGSVWPVRRVTLQHPRSEWPMDALTAAHYFRATDDLTTDLPDRDDRPAAQNWDLALGPNNASMPLARQWTGDYSWLVTVVPTTNPALEGMARNPESFAYDVSVVVFYKRVLPDDAMTVGNFVASSPTPGDEYGKFRDAMGDQERAVRASVVSTGLNGGELLLTDLGDNLSGKSPFSELKIGQWLMLCGPHPNSTSTEPRFSLNWYQVLSIDSELAAGLITNPATQRVVAVRGPQWPWQPQNLTDKSRLSNNLCVGICRGAVAVHTKTLRLEGSSGSSWGINSSSTTELPNNVAR